jgi:hypothetical protein
MRFQYWLNRALKPTGFAFVKRADIEETCMRSVAATELLSTMLQPGQKLVYWPNEKRCEIITTH